MYIFTQWPKKWFDSFQYKDTTHLVNIVKVVQEEDFEIKQAEVKPVEKQEDCFTDVSGQLRRILI